MFIAGALGAGIFPACTATPDQSAAGKTVVPPSTKDVAVLVAIREHPVTCHDDAACAFGSHCDSKAEKCAWECLGSSDCGPHGACSADGRCVARSGAEARTGAASGGVVVGGLHPMALVGQSCTYTDECAANAYCDNATRVCKSDCTVATDCSGGNACVHGLCAPAPTNLPRVELSSTAVQIKQQDASIPLADGSYAKRIDLVATTADQSFAGKTRSLHVKVSPSAELQVNCAPADMNMPSTGYGGECTLTDWTFAAVPSGARAQKTIWIRMIAPPSSDPTKLLPSVTVTSPDTTVGERVITVDLPASARTPITTPEGEYTGTVTLEGTGVTDSATQSIGLADQTIQVTAVRTATGVLLFDETRQLSPSGTLFYSLKGGGYSEGFLSLPAKSPYLGDSAGDTGALGQLVFVDSSLPLTFDNGKLTGRLTFDALRKVRFDLQRTADVSHASCSTASPCNTGVCDSRMFVCVAPEFSWTKPTANVGNTMAQTRFKTWSTMAGAALTNASIIGTANIATGGLAVAEQTACFTGAGTLDKAAPFGSKILNVSGELACADANGSAPRPIPLFTFQDVAPNDPAATDAIYAACLKELRTDAPTTTTGDNVFGTGGFGGKAPSCIHFGRFSATLQAAKKNDPGLYVNLIRQWVGLHTFVAQQGRIQWQEGTILAAAANPSPADITAGSPQTLFQLLEQLERGWDLLLSSDVQSTLVAAPRTIQLNPDFRLTHVGDTSTANQEQATGLPVAIAEGLTEYLNVLETLMQGMAADAYGWCTNGGSSSTRDTMQERIGTTLRYAMAIDDNALVLRRGLGQLTPAWQSKWESAHAQYLAARQRISRRANDLFACKNPLGLSDDSLPIFFADPVGASDRYFASSDNMRSLASGKIADAAKDQADAQAAWTAARTEQFQDLANQAQFDQRVDDMLTQLSKPINDACGGSFDARPYLDGTKTPSIDIVTKCHMDTTRADCVGSREAACYHGGLGEAALEVIAAADDVKLAESSWQDAQASYDSQFSFCLQEDADNKTDNTIDALHNKTMTDLRSSKETADIIGIAADAAGACASGAVASFGAACAAAAVGAIAKSYSTDFQVQMEQSEEDHQDEMAARSRTEKSEECYHEADMRHVGIHTAQQTIDRRGTDEQIALLKFNDLQQGVLQQLTEGRAAVAREKGRKLPSIAHHHWLGDAVAKFTYDMNLAQKYTYLSLQAMEFDLQRSFPYRVDIVKARTPTELGKVLDNMTADLNTRTINGQRPGPSAAPDYRVVSVRDQLLNLRTNIAATGPNDFHVFDPDYDINTRLRDRLRDPASAFYGKDGTYKGQGIAFTLTGPNKKAAAGKSVPIDEWNFPGADVTCAERLWGISATIAGDDIGSMPTGLLQVLKRNTFYAAWCAPTQQSTEFEVGNYRPTGYIFGIDPNTPAVNDQTQTFLPALLTVPFQKMRSEMEAPVSPAPVSEDLAGRGLYGDYILLFPPTLLNDPRFNIQGLEDVLIRFEFYRVSLNPGL